ncbi:MAG: glycoside hydrolase family 127 protein [Acidobacteriaceae bacterium]|nr:glycoside hydrolase family 127 protein [Acidobacteriaceae bacterium]
MLKRLDAARLLHNLRINAGLSSSAKPLGGWEKPDCELRGHFVGHYLSACALMYSSTGDDAVKEKGEYILAELAKCQEKLGGGYLSAFPLEFFDRLNMREKVWGRSIPFTKLWRAYTTLMSTTAISRHSRCSKAWQIGPTIGPLPSPSPTCKTSSTPNTAA